MARAVALIVVLLVGHFPWSADAEVKSRLFPQSEDESGVLRLAQVVAVATRQQIVDSGDQYIAMLMSGIPDAQLGDGRLAFARVYCCGGSAEESEAIGAFVPPDTTVGAGDVVEVRMGRNPDDKDLGTVNVVARVRQTGEMSAGRSCRWLPDDPGLQSKVLYCDNIETEGWIQQKGSLREMWHRPAALFLVLVSPNLQGPVRAAAAASVPPVSIGFEGEPATEDHPNILALSFDSVVDQTRQRSNRDGASTMGLLGWMVGSITPWACTTIHTLTGVVTDRAGRELGRHAVQKEQKRLGTMLVCGKVDEPNDAIVGELMTDLLQKLKDEGRLPEPAVSQTVPGPPETPGIATP